MNKLVPYFRGAVSEVIFEDIRSDRIQNNSVRHSRAELLGGMRTIVRINFYIKF